MAAGYDPHQVCAGTLRSWQILAFCGAQGAPWLIDIGESLYLAFRWNAGTGFWCLIVLLRLWSSGRLWLRTTLEGLHGSGTTRLPSTGHLPFCTFAHLQIWTGHPQPISFPCVAESQCCACGWKRRSPPTWDQHLLDCLVDHLHCFFSHFHDCLVDHSHCIFHYHDCISDNLTDCLSLYLTNLPDHLTISKFYNLFQQLVIHLIHLW